MSDHLTKKDDVRDMENIEMLRLEEVNLSELIKEVNNEIIPLYTKKNLLYSIIGLSYEDRIVVDPLRFKQILYNLLSNSIKNTNQGRINLKISQNKDYWEFQVGTTGEEIAEYSNKIICKEFQDIENTTSEKNPIEDLNLDKIKRLVNYHNGKISFESDLGQHAVFCFTIPKKIDVEERDG